MKRFTEDHRATLVRLRTQGLSWEAIGKQMGFDGSYVARIGQQMGLAPKCKRAKTALEAAWTDERVALLTKLWRDGLSTPEIGRRLHITKNAAIGKLQRLGLGGRARAAAPKSPRPARPAAAAKHRAPPVKRGPDNPLGNRKAKAPSRAFSNPIQARVFGSPTSYRPERPDTAPRVKRPLVIDASCACRIEDLTDTRCKFPLGDPRSPTFVYCGRSKPADGSPYCASHHALSYKPPEAVKDAKALIRSLRKHIAA